MSVDRFNSLLVCVDVSARGFDEEGPPPAAVQACLSEVNWIREQSGASVTLMTVVEGDDVDSEILDLARHRLEEIVLPHLKGDVEVAVSHGTAHVEIIRKVLRDGHDLVVLSARRAGRVHPTLVGSVSLHVLRQCPCPVFVAPRTSETGPKVVLSAVALHDFTSSVLELSAAVVKLRGGQWHIYHCPEYPAEGGMRLKGASVEETETYEAGVRKHAWDEIHQLCDPLAEQTGVTPEFWMSEGLPSEQIVLAVRKLKADLLVLGTVGRPGLVAGLVGNTAEKVIHSVECSILAVKPEGFESSVGLEG